MKAVLIRTGSVPVQSQAVPGSPKVCLFRHDSVSGVFSGETNSVNSSRISLHLEINRRRDAPARGIRRAFSESDVIRSEIRGASRLSGAGSRSFPVRIPEEEYLSDNDINDEEVSLLLRKNGFGEANHTGLSGGGNGGDNGIKTFSGGNGSDRSKIGDYYKAMLKSNPGDSLLLRNYAKFLHEVEKDTVGAEEYYGRAILANPGDGELLSLYGKLIWETQRDDVRAKSYFDQAVYASPDDCMVLGSYANFMWEAEEDEDEDEDDKEEMKDRVEVSPALVAAF